MLKKYVTALALFLIALVWQAPVVVAAPMDGPADTATATMQDGLIVLQNHDLRVALDPNVGGRIVDYRYKPFGDINLCFPAASDGGMTMDMFWQQKWPGELLKNPYQFEIVSAGPKQAVVRVWRLSTGETNNQMIEDVAGIRVQRTFTLDAGARALHVAVSLLNTTQKGKLAGYWMQNNFFLQGRKEANTWYRPTIYGVDKISVEKPSPYYGYFVEAPTAGWIGVANTQMNGGLMFVMDYNDLWKLYTNMGAVTTEWFYDRVAIPAGKSWETGVSIVPTPGLNSYAFGSNALVASLSASPEGKTLTVTHSLTAGSTGLTSATVKTSAVSATGAWTSAPVEQKVGPITDSVTTLTTTLPDAGAPPLAVNVEVTGTTPQGETVTVHYGDYYSGAAGRNIDLVTLKPQYSFPVPAKHKVFLKPDTIVKAKNDHMRVLFIRGLWHQYSGVDEALAQIKGAEVVNSWYTESDTGSSLLNFPSDYNELMSYDVIVLADVDGGSLGLVGQEMMADFVAAGGGLYFVGGDRTYGQADFENPRFLKLLPMQLQGPFDWHKYPAPASLSADGGLLDGLKFDPQTVALYRHTLKPADGATVQVVAGGAPALVTMPVGAGKVAASLLLPFGEPPAADTGYWKSPQWFEAVQRTLLWLGNQPR